MISRNFTVAFLRKTITAASKTSAIVVIIGSIEKAFSKADVTELLTTWLIPASQKSASVYNKVNMLFKCIFYSAERSELLDYNPSATISAKGGTPAKDKDALTDEQVKVLLDTVRELPL